MQIFSWEVVLPLSSSNKILDRTSYIFPYLPSAQLNKFIIPIITWDHAQHRCGIPTSGRPYAQDPPEYLCSILAVSRRDEFLNGVWSPQASVLIQIHFWSRYVVFILLFPLLIYHTNRTMGQERRMYKVNGARNTIRLTFIFNIRLKKSFLLPTLERNMVSLLWWW